jgi:hypothetical protein
MLGDGVLTDDEHDRLVSIRERLGLSDQQAAEIMHLMRRRHEGIRCPHCGHELTPGNREPG